MALTVAQVKNVNATVARLNVSPFLSGQPTFLRGVTGTPTVYGVDHVGTASAQYCAYKGDGLTRAFVPPTTMTKNVAENTSITAAKQLETIVLKDGVMQLRKRSDNVPVTSGYVIAAGGGTAIADATIIVSGLQAIGTTDLSIKSTGANTLTLLIGDSITIAGDTTVYWVNETSQAMNGTNAVTLTITPPLKAAAADLAAITVNAAPTNNVIIFAATPALNAKVELMYIGPLVAGNTYTGGATVAGQTHEVNCREFNFTAGNVDFIRAKS